MGFNPQTKDIAMDTYAWVCLIVNLRNVLARWCADTCPDDSGEVKVDSYASAYDAFEAQGFRMYGSFGNAGADVESIDTLTTASGFHPLSGEAIGIAHDMSDYRVSKRSSQGAMTRYCSDSDGLVSTDDFLDTNPSVADTADEREEQAELASEIRFSAQDVDNEILNLSAEENPDHARIAMLEHESNRLYSEADSAATVVYTSGRFDHMRAQHLAEQAAYEKACNQPVGKPGPLTGEMEASKASREAYAARILRDLHRMRLAYSKARKQGAAYRMMVIEGSAKAYKRTIRAEYSRIARNLGPGKDSLRWRFLPLTKAQLESLGV